MGLLKVSEVVWTVMPNGHRIYDKASFIVQVHKKMKLDGTDKWIYVVFPNSFKQCKWSDDHFNLEFDSLEQAKQAAINKAVEEGLLEDDREKPMEYEWKDSGNTSFLKQNNKVTVHHYWGMPNKGFYYVSLRGLSSDGQRYDGSKNDQDKFLSMDEAKIFAIKKATEMGMVPKSKLEKSIPYEELEIEVKDTRTTEEKIAQAISNYHERRKYL